MRCEPASPSELIVYQSSSDVGGPGSPGQGFRVETSLEEGRAVIFVAGEVDVVSAPKLRQALDSVLASGAAAIDLSLEDVTFFDSQGVGIVLATHKRLAKSAGTMRIIGPKPQVMSVLTICGITQFVEVIPGRER